MNLYIGKPLVFHQYQKGHMMNNEDNLENSELLEMLDQNYASSEIEYITEVDPSEITGDDDISYSIELNDYTENFNELKILQETANESLLEINLTLQHLDKTIEYGVCLLIIILIIFLMQYVYKFFNMFF